MFYFASKIVWFFGTPSNLLAALSLLGLVLMLFKRYRGKGFIVSAFAATCIMAFGILPVVNWVILPLEERFPTLSLPEVTGIIVLGGAVQADETFARGSLSVNESGDRIIAMADLARKHPGAKVVFAGGAGALLGDEPSEASAVQQFLPALGLSPERVVFDNESRNTVENARNVVAMLKPKDTERWALVTSAFHMPRAVGCFRKVGLDVVPYPVDFRTRGPQDMWRPFGTVSDGLRRFDLAAKEWVGLLAYYLLGHTDELFPGPR